MLIYSATKRDFRESTNLNKIANILSESFREHHISGGQEAEKNAWRISLQYMKNAVEVSNVPDDVEIAIEYQIPRTSKRVDFMIGGMDDNGNNNVVIVELKQWTSAEKVDDIMLHSVRTFVGGAYRVVSHPSYQVYSYAQMIKNTSGYVQDNRVGIIPCAYLHNCEPANRAPLDDDIYKDWVSEAPLFVENQVEELGGFIRKYITKRSVDGQLLYKIDNDGNIRPSKALQDCLVSLMTGNQEFIMLDDQVVAFDMCTKIMEQCKKDGKKRCAIIQGGPGTGKSVLAINLLYEFTAKKTYNVNYCTKNNAPREAYKYLLAKSDLKAKANIESLFRSPFGLSKIKPNFYDCLIVDEAHRLVKKMYGDWNGENQVKECIAASLFTIFLIDENQHVTKSDIGSIEEIKKWANVLGHKVYMNDEMVLRSQFRCNGSDAYIQLINNILQIGDTVDVDLSKMNFDFRVFDDPNELRNELRKLNEVNNKSRMVAGYCYDWNVKKHRGEYDIYLKNDFKAKWNLDGDKIWAINKNSFEQVGCIHTAQGLEFDYVGVLIGKDLRYDSTTGQIITDKTMISKDDNSSKIRTSSDDEAKYLIKNTYKTLLTRGQKGCFVFCEDDALRDYIKSFINKN